MNRFSKRVALLLLFLSILLCILPSCSKHPPALEEIYDPAVALIEASFVINDIAFGQGLPVWALDSSYAVQMNIYHNRPNYVQITPYSDFQSVEQIKQRMEAVYSEDYVTSLYAPLFDGYAYEEGAMISQYHEDSTRMYQRRDYDPLLEGQRIYDYSTMRVVDGDKGYAVIAIDTHLEHEEKILTVELSLVLEENGWRLDTPTY